MNEYFDRKDQKIEIVYGIIPLNIKIEINLVYVPNRPFKFTYNTGLFTDLSNSIFLLGETKMYLKIDLKSYRNYLIDSEATEDLWMFSAKINIVKLGQHLKKFEKREILRILLEKMEFSDFNIKSKSGKHYPVHKCVLGLYFSL